MGECVELLELHSRHFYKLLKPYLHTLFYDAVSFKHGTYLYTIDAVANISHDLQDIFLDDTIVEGLYLTEQANRWIEGYMDDDLVPDY